MRGLSICSVLTMLLVSSCPARGQECEVLRTATPDKQLSYLKAVKPDAGNAECVTFVIQKLGTERYGAAIDTLSGMLDFRRPPIGREKQGLYLHAQGIWEIYPAAGALVVIGKESMPALLTILKSESSSMTARQNAVFVWMQLHKYEPARGISLLAQEEAKTNKSSLKQQLLWAVHKAVGWCNPDDQAACQQATATP